MMEMNDSIINDLIIKYNLDILSYIDDENRDRICVDFSNILIELLSKENKIDTLSFIKNINKLKQKYNILIKRCKNLDIWEYFNDNYISLVQEKFLEKDVIIPFPSYHYNKLELSKNSTVEDIKKRYKKLALIHHPDKGGDQDLFNSITTSKNICIEYLNKII